MTIKEFFSFKSNKMFWLNIFGMIVVACLLLWGTLKWLDVYTRHGEAVQVPDVKGMTVYEADRTFKACGLVCMVTDSIYVKDKLPGIVLDVIPQVGQRVKEGRTVYLTVNTLNVPLHTLPDVADNSSLRQAEAQVLAAGFKLTENEWISGEKDWVYGVKYNGRELQHGEQVPAGATVTLIVGDGTVVEENDSILGLYPDSLESGYSEPVEESWF